MVCASWPGSVLFQTVTKFGVSSCVCVCVWSAFCYGILLPGMGNLAKHKDSVKNSVHLTVAEAAVGDFGGITNFLKHKHWAWGSPVARVMCEAAGELPWEQEVSLLPQSSFMGCCTEGGGVGAFLHGLQVCLCSIMDLMGCRGTAASTQLYCELQRNLLWCLEHFLC